MFLRAVERTVEDGASGTQGTCELERISFVCPEIGGEAESEHLGVVR